MKANGNLSIISGSNDSSHSAEGAGWVWTGQTGPATAPTWGRSSEREGHGAPVELRSAMFMALWHLLLWAAPPKETELWKFKGILYGIGSIKATHAVVTGDHYRTLEAIKQLDRVINDSSQGPADPAQ